MSGMKLKQIKDIAMTGSPQDGDLFAFNGSTGKWHSASSANIEKNNNRGKANGYVGLDSNAKIPITHLPDSLVGQVQYQGTWNASTDTPTLPDATASKGYYYVTSAAGTYETISYAIGDWVISNGTAWEKVDNTDAVTSVFGRIGAIIAAESDYSSFYPTISQFNTAISQSRSTESTLTSQVQSNITEINNLGGGLSNKISTDSNASLNNLTTGGLSVEGSTYLSGGISSIGQVGDRYSITTGGLNSLFISNNTSIPYSFFEVNNDYIKSTDGSNGGFVQLSSTLSKFSTHANSSEPNSSTIRIAQSTDYGTATIDHISGNLSLGRLDVVSNVDISLVAGVSNPQYGGRISFSSPGGFAFISSDVTMYNNLSVIQDITARYITSTENINSDKDIIAGGRVLAEGDIVAFYSSDKRLKDNIEQIPNAIDKIQSIGGYSFNWNDKQDTYEVGSRDIGVIAQEVEEVLPELVTTRDNGYKAVKYEKMVALLIEGMKEQQQQINELKEQINGTTN